MLSKGEMLSTPSLRRYILAIIVSCTSVWWASAVALAQDAPPTGLSITGHLTSSSLERPGAEKTPYLVIGMADRWDPPAYGSSPIAGDEATDSSGGDTLTRRLGPASSMNRPDKIESGRLVLSSLTNLQAEPASPRQTIQRLPNLADANVYSLLDDGSAPESFLYGYPPNYLPSTERITDNESPTDEIGQAPSPLLQLGFGGWSLPVMLSNAAVSR